MNKDLLRKYFEDKYTHEELESIVKWIKETSHARDEEQLMNQIWNEIPDDSTASEAKLDLILDKIHHNLEIKKHGGSSKSNIHRIFSFVRNAAAILMLPVLGMAVFMSLQHESAKLTVNKPEQVFNEVYSSVDAITKVTLPDGSNVWLNHRSSLRYPAVFQNNLRTVELEGEGYFEVFHNPESPFIVKTGSINVVAHGTTFDVLAYPEENQIETYLIDGRVEIRKITPDGKIVQHVELKPSDAAVYNKSDDEIVIHKISNESYFSWKDSKLIFINEYLGDVVDKLSRWYNVDFQIQDPELLDLTFTGTLINETLSEVMELMALATPIEYTISNREKLSSGDFSKRFVTIKRKNK